MRVAITGGIGSGKSYVCRLLAGRGIEVYDCDAAAKRIMRTSDMVRRRLTALIGADTYLPDGRLNKPVVARFLLSSETNNRRINAIVHPAVAADFAAWQPSGRAHQPKVMECAILFESGFDRLVDITACVVAPESLRLSRIMQRDGLTAAAAREWIGRQMPQDEVAARCHHIIVNDGTADLDSQIDTLLHICARKGAAPSLTTNP